MSNKNQPTQSNAMIYAIVALVVIVALIIAIVLASGRDSGEAQTEVQRSGSLIPLDEAVDQTAPISMIGEALPKFAGGDDPAIGMTPPVITATYFNGTETTIDFADGTPRLVVFFAHWCPHCQDEVPVLVERFETGGFPPGVRLTGVSTDVRSGSPNYPPAAWLLDERWPMPVLRDSADNGIAAALGLSGYPYMVAVNGDGEVTYRRSGSPSEAELDSVLAELSG